MRILTAVFNLFLLLPTTHAAACSLASQGPEQDLPPLVRTSDAVFVARFTGYSRFVPPGSDHYMGRMEYVLMDAIKGRPATQGALFEWTGEPAIEGVAPGPACGPWVVLPDNVGVDYLVFATLYPETGRLVPDAFSIRLDPPTPESARLLDFVRTLPQHDSTP